MASENKIVVFDGNLTASGIGPIVDLPQRTKYPIAWLDVTAINAATVLDVVVEMSPDKVNWVPAESFGTVNGTQAKERKNVQLPIFEFWRINATLAGATQDATFKVEFYYDPN